MDKQRTLGIACVPCKFTFHYFTARKYTLDILDGKNFVYCPLCGKAGVTLDSVLDVMMWEGAMKWSMPIDLYRKLHVLYMDYVNTREESGPPQTIDTWIKNLLKEQLS